MATNTYVALDKVTVGTATATVDFTSISGSYTDLILIINCTTATSGDDLWIRVNSDTGTNYSSTVLSGNGTAAASSRRTSLNRFMADAAYPNTVQGFNQIIHFMNYANTSTYKTFLSRANKADLGTGATVGLWRSTSAITSINLLLASSLNFAAGSTFSLYGIKADTNATAKATGGVISSDSTYWYHTFAMSGTFTPSQSLTCDYMIVAGGGGGGGGTFTNANGGGGGGAGGLRTFTSQSFSATSDTVTVGAGGTGGSTSVGYGSNGSTTSFFSTSASGGGGGGSEAVTNNGNLGRGSNGGSGGGSSQIVASGPATGNSGGYSPVEGYNAGSAGSGSSSTGTGGGGAGGLGGDRGTGNGSPGNGGIGATSSLINAIGAATSMGQLSSSNYYFAGGGGGGTYDQGTGGIGGIGGGGNGGGVRTIPGYPGTAFTGGGGGGSDSASGVTAGGNGGSGIVIVRYAK